MDAPIKRGRGRPRKTAIIPEEVIFTNNQVDLSDLKSAPIASEAPPQEYEVEEIQLAGDQEHEEPVRDLPDAVLELEARNIILEEPKPQPQPTVVYLPAPEPVFDESKEKARRHSALTRIKKYREAFPAIGAMRFSEDWSTDALESHLEDIRIAVSAKNTGLLVKGVYLAGIKGIEVGTCAVGVKSYGLTDLLSKSAEIDGLIKEVSCEMGVGHVPATTRLLLATMQTVFVLDSVNRRAELLGNFKQEPIAETISSKYSDL